MTLEMKMDLKYEEGLNIGIAHGIELGLKELVTKKDRERENTFSNCGRTRNI